MSENPETIGRSQPTSHHDQEILENYREIKALANKIIR